jgi:hypothetical protein
MVNIAGLDKAEVLAALHAATHAQGMGLLHDKGPLSVDECRGIIAAVGAEDAETARIGRLYFDYLRGRVMKVDISGDEFDPRLFDRDNYNGAAHDAIQRLREHVGVPR